MKKTLILITLLAASACSGNKDTPATGSAPNGAGMTIAVIPKGTTHAFWQSIRAGAENAGKELGVNIVWRGPLREDDRDAQVSEVENAVSRGVSGICLAPLDASALVQPVQEAPQKKIPDGIFTPNESVSFAVLRVLQDNGWAGKVKFVGFDASPNLVKGLRDGNIDGLVVQDPVRMGYLAVKTMVTHLKGEKVEKWIDTGV